MTNFLKMKETHSEDLETYDILLATDISNEASKKRIPFYNSIGYLCKKLGYNCFLPHQHVGIGNDEFLNRFMPAEEAYDLIQNIITPKVKLVIYYADIISMDVGHMVGRAIVLNKPLIGIYSKKNREVVRKSEESGLTALIPEQDETLQEIRRVKINYPRTVIEFESDEECLSSLEREIQRFFSLK